MPSCVDSLENKFQLAADHTFHYMNPVVISAEEAVKLVKDQDTVAVFYIYQLTARRYLS